MYSHFFEKTNGVAAQLPVITVGNGAVNGVAVDRLGYLSCAVFYIAGICPSVPTGFTVALKVQHSDTTTSGDFVDFATLETFGTASDLSAASVAKYYDVNLRGAKRYIRTVETLTFTGGSSPSQLASIGIVLGDKNVEPVANATVYGS